MKDYRTELNEVMSKPSCEQKKRQKRDIEIIVDNILNYCDYNLEAIILCGGYGRGEGAWIQDIDGNPAPYNDYDIAVVSKKSFSNADYEKLRTKIASKIGISWIDIDWYTPEQLENLSPTIKNFDLLHASTVIYGDQNILKSVHDIDSKKIGEYDIVTLYKTRIWTFLGSWKGDFHNLIGDEAVFFKNQMAKAILAACDMLLVKDKQYTPSYKERVKLVKSQYECNGKIKELSEWALKEKLYPSSESISVDYMERLSWDSNCIWCQALQVAMGKRYGYFENPYLTKRYFCLYTKYFFANIYNHVFRSSRRAEKLLDIFLAQNFVFLANDKKNVNNRYIQEACNILIKWGYMESKTSDWNRVREVVAFARNNI